MPLTIFEYNLKFSIKSMDVLIGEEKYWEENQISSEMIRFSLKSVFDGRVFSHILQNPIKSRQKNWMNSIALPTVDYYSWRER